MAAKALVSSRVQRQWKPPLAGWYKINCDAVVFRDDNVRLGGVMRDDVRDVVAASCVWEQGNFAVDVAEAMAERHALSIAMEAGFSSVIVETDFFKACHTSFEEEEGTLRFWQHC